MPASEQRSVIAAGLLELTDRLGFAPSPVFVPPFNGFDETTATVVSELGFRILSAEERPSRVSFPNELIELSCNVDVLSGYYPPQLKGVDQVVREVAATSATSGHVGIVFHPSLIVHSVEWLDTLVRGLTDNATLRSLTLCQLAEMLYPSGKSPRDGLNGVVV
jgi:hypothetical protein